MEYLDILDENGNKTGESRPRSEVHSKGYWHKGIHVWIINSNKELLVQRRSANKDVYPNKLHISVAGHCNICLPSRHRSVFSWIGYVRNPR